jgi:hypothetical protein
MAAFTCFVPGPGDRDVATCVAGFWSADDAVHKDVRPLLRSDCVCDVGPQRAVIARQDDNVDG